MLDNQWWALGACLLLFAWALRYSARAAHDYHIWYKNEKDQAKARDLFRKLQQSGVALPPVAKEGTNCNSEKKAARNEDPDNISEEQRVARRACPFAIFAQRGAKCPVSGKTNNENIYGNINSDQTREDPHGAADRHTECERVAGKSGIEKAKDIGVDVSGRPSLPRHPNEKYGDWYITNKMTGMKIRERSIRQGRLIAMPDS